MNLLQCLLLLVSWAKVGLLLLENPGLYMIEVVGLMGGPMLVVQQE